MDNVFWFSLFLAVPIVVHLFHFRRTKKIIFTNVRFIKSASSETKSKTRLKHYLILLSRLVAFVFILFSFFSFLLVDKNLESSEGSETYFYLDNSLSSIYEEQFVNISSFEKIVESVDFNEAYFLTNDFLPFSNQKRYKEEIIGEVGNTNISFVDRPLSEVINRMDDGPIRAYIFSDLQTAGLETLQSIKLDSLSSYRMYLNRSSPSNNVFVDTLILVRNLDDYNYFNLSCFLGHTNEQGNENYVVKLIDDSGAQLASVVANSDNGFKVDFSIPKPLNTSSYEIRISGDEVLYDNEFYLVLEGVQPPSILILGQQANNYLSSVFSNADLFNLTVPEGANIDYELIQDMDLVILDGYFRLPQGLIKQNASQVSFLVIPPDTFDMVNYSEETGFLIDEIGLSEKSELEIPLDYMTGIFDEVVEDVSFPQSIALFDVKNSFEEMVSLRNGKSFLVKSPVSSVYLMTAPLSDPYTDLPTHSIFLPLMYRVAEMSTRVDRKTHYCPGEYIEISKSEPEHPPKIISEDLVIIPEFSSHGNSLLIKVPNSLAPRFYHVLDQGDTIKSFGLNLPKNESLLSDITLPDIKEYFSDVSHVDVQSTQNLEVDILRAESKERNIWKYTLILAMVFLTMETVLHKYLK